MVTIASAAGSRWIPSIALGMALGGLSACSSNNDGPPLGQAVSGSGGAAGTSVSTTMGGSTPAAGGTTGGAGVVPITNGGADGGTAGSADAGGAAGVAGAGGAAGAAGTGGAGGSGGASTCNGAALCDSFERAMLGPDWVLDNNQNSTMIELVTNKGHTGTNSVHISFGTQSTQSFISEMKTFPAMGNQFWGRAWIYSMVPLGGHQIYVEARVGPGSDKTGVRSFNTFDKNNGYLGLNLESSDASKNSMIKMTTGSWVCYEWQITGIGGMGGFTSWVDGQMIATQNGAIPSLGRERIGIQRYDAGTAGEMWIDDVAIGSQRINCTP